MRVQNNLTAFNAVYVKWSAGSEAPTVRLLLEVMDRLRARHGDQTTVEGTCNLLRDIRACALEALVDLNVASAYKNDKVLERVSSRWVANQKIQAELVWTCLRQVTTQSMEAYQVCLMDLAKFTMIYEVDLETEFRSPNPTAAGPPESVDASNSA